MCYRAERYSVCRRIRASFSPEILQAGAVKGLSRCVIGLKDILFAGAFVHLSARKFYRLGQ